MSGLLRQPDAPTARTYLGIGGTGSGSVTNFKAGAASPLFTTTVFNSTTYPDLEFNLLYIPIGVVTNADGTAFSLIQNSSPPGVGIKGIKAGGNVTITDNGVNLVISAANSGGGASGIDQTMQTVSAADGATNWVVDFSWPAQLWNPTGAVYMNFATNWGLANTSRVTHVWIPATNYFRPVYYINAATNWHQQVRTLMSIPTGYAAKLDFQVFGQLDTNVTVTASIDNFPTTTNWLLSSFNPTNSQGNCVLWIDAAGSKFFQDEFTNNPIAPNMPVRATIDMSGFSGKLTNGNTSCNLFYRTPNDSPFNIPSLNFTTGGFSYLVSSNFSADLAQPSWAFMMYYGRGTPNFVFLDGLSEGHRFACQPSESPIVSFQMYSGSSLSAVSAPDVHWRLFEFFQNNTSSLIFTNGVQAASGTSGTQGPGRWTVGSDYPLSSFVGNVNLAEIIVYHSNLTTLQRQTVEQYFRTKYGAW